MILILGYKSKQMQDNLYILYNFHVDNLWPILKNKPFYLYTLRVYYRFWICRKFKIYR